MKFPALDPNRVTFIPTNSIANLADIPIFRAPVVGGLVAARVFTRTAVTGANADYIDINLHKLGNTTHSYAAINVIAGVNTTANTWLDLTLDSDYVTWDAAETIALTVTFADEANANIGAAGDNVKYQIDWLPSSYPRGG